MRSAWAQGRQQRLQERGLFGAADEAPESFPQGEIGIAAGVAVRGQGQGLFQEAQDINRGNRRPGGEPLTVQMFPELIPGLALEGQEVAFPEALLVAEAGHQEVAAQGFPGGLPA